MSTIVGFVAVRVYFWSAQMGYSAHLDVSTTVWRQVCIPKIYLMAILFLFLAGLQWSDSSHVHGTRGIGGQLPFSQDLDGQLFRSDHLQLNGRLEKETTGAQASAKVDLATTTRKLMDTSMTTGGFTNQGKRDSNSTRAPDVEVEALVAFKGAIVNDPFSGLKSWNIGGADVNGSNMCNEWAGVTCSPQFPNHVVALNLSNLQLDANIHVALLSLGHLPFLQRLDLSMNLFGGSIQGETLTNFSLLSYFSLHKNVVTGDIPSEIGKLVSLRNLTIRHNHMTGPLPESLGNCSLLAFIDLSVNLLQGVIPPSLGKLSGLQYLDASFNHLSGDVPGALGNCSYLRVLALGRNFGIGGLLPQEMSGLKQLQVLTTEFCDFLAFPSWIVNLTSLYNFSMYGNHMQGEIPENIGELQFLGLFTVAENNMKGVIPLSIYNLTSLYKFHTALNNFSGHIPSQIGLLPSLQTLIIQWNQHTGVIPSSLANCTTLSSLGLGFNPTMDAEPIPSWIGSLTNLTYLDLRGINLQGEVPGYSIGKLSNLQQLQFDSNNLTGRIPSALRNCTPLYKLTATDNYLTGDIPSELGALTNMKIFLVNANHLTGFFPEFIANWTHLSILEIDDNHLSGFLYGHMKIDHLAELEWLTAGDNHFEGIIPEAIGNSSSILLLSIFGNRLSGAIPASLGNMTSLQTLDLRDNNLQGQIPISLLTSGLGLAGLDLSQNELKSSIPVEIGQLNLLTELWLNNNMFTGVLPSSIGNFSQMSILDLSDNKLEGYIPGVAISRMSASLASLNLSRNLFTGSWPVEFGELINIQIINVSSNNISGSMRLGLGRCVNLESLDVSFNNLTGEIPQDLGELVHLKFFNASFNNFSGPIPQSGFFNTNRINESSFFGNPGLCGPIAIIGLKSDQQCAAIRQNVSSHQNCKGVNCKQVWVPIVAVGIFAVAGATFFILGIKFRWILNRGERDDLSAAHVILNFSTYLNLSKTDVLQTIHPENVIGVGARSVVYKGVLSGGDTFALKHVLPDRDADNQHGDSKRGVDLNTSKSSDLLKEAEILAKLRHKNIVTCLGFYSSLDHKALMLEYMCEGSLHKHLHEMGECKLTWQTRLKIAMGVAQGLKYLHHDFPEPLIHRDLKPSNILLDADLESKVSDFDISKFVDARRGDGEASASKFCGTIGYMPPEYSSQPWVSTKGDVYGYGMVLIEIMTGRQPCLANASEDQGVDLRTWVLDNFQERAFAVLDPSLVNECSLDNTAMEQMMLLLRVSLFCTRADPHSRPSIADVVGMLNNINSLGVEPLIRRTVEELANDITPTTWVAEDPAIEGAEFGSSG